LQGALAKLYTHPFWVLGNARMLTLLIAAHPTNVAIFSAFVYSTHILYDHQGDFQHAAKTIGDHAEKSLPIEPFLGYVKSRFANSGL
jgi:hypothetical protein